MICIFSYRVSFSLAFAKCVVFISISDTGVMLQLLLYNCKVQFKPFCCRSHWLPFLIPCV
uniref:Uncharacterized protein n=1 Tax=Rhizophora mucronata TaxID=61149 RepID=A0A2P2N984_RHIMU